FIGKNQNPSAVIPAKAGIQSVQFRSFPINACCFSFLDSHFRGNDDGRVLVILEALKFQIPACAGMTIHKFPEIPT
ncbi:hypothetical protein, partial [Neisseria meningitidis]|uniref:hypothetical protein n=1 Tax=Neisseria meningitidis TaxID=487 RepID=UPI001E37A7EF